MIITNKKEVYEALVVEVEKMVDEFNKKGITKKVKYLNIGLFRFRLTFDLGTENNVIKVEAERRSIYGAPIVWNTSNTEKSFSEYIFDNVKNI